MNLGKRNFLLHAVKFNIVEFHMPLYFEVTKKFSLFKLSQNSPNSDGDIVLKLSFLYITNINIQKNIRNNKCYCEFYYNFFLKGKYY